LKQKKIELENENKNFQKYGKKSSPSISVELEGTCYNVVIDLDKGIKDLANGWKIYDYSSKKIYNKVPQKNSCYL